MLQQLQNDKDKYIETLETVNRALVDKITDLNKRQARRNTEASIKWRGKAFYYKKKIDDLVRYCRERGWEVPDEKIYNSGT